MMIAQMKPEKVEIETEKVEIELTNNQRRVIIRSKTWAIIAKMAMAEQGSCTEVINRLLREELVRRGLLDSEKKPA